MIDYNFFYIKLFTNNIINNYVVSIYCNNFNYDQYLYKTNNVNLVVTFNDIIVHKKIKFIYLQFKNLYNDQITIFYIIPQNNVYKLKINDDIIHLKIREKQYVNLQLLEFNNLHKLDDSQTYIYHRDLQTIVPEIKNKKYNWFINVLSYNGAISSSLRKFFTNVIGFYLKSSLSKHLINDFIKFYNVNMDKYIDSNYNSFNDFFIRKLLHNPISVLKTDESKSKAILQDFTFVSPCSSRIMVFKNIDQSQFTTWIKGTQFNTNTLIKEELPDNNIKSLFICRLAVQDYHHFHMPYIGILVSKNIVGSDLYSVQPQLINSSINVLTENYRCIYKFKSKNIDNVEFFFWVVAVGALISGSIQDKLIIGNLYNKNEIIGNFSLGGSTVIVLSSEKINFDNDIEYYSNNHIETYIKVSDRIGNIGPNTSNNNYFPTHYSIKKNTDNLDIYNINNNNNNKLLIYIIIICMIYLIFKFFLSSKKIKQ